MARMFQVCEADLMELEEVLPKLCESMQIQGQQCDIPTRTRWRKVKEILSNIRWNYGPFDQAEQVDGQ